MAKPWPQASSAGASKQKPKRQEKVESSVARWKQASHRCRSRNCENAGGFPANYHLMTERLVGNGQQLRGLSAAVAEDNICGRRLTAELLYPQREVDQRQFDPHTAVRHPVSALRHGMVSLERPRGAS